MKYTPKDLGKTADNSRGLISRKQVVKNVLGVVVVFVAVYFLLGALADLMARHLPDRLEAKMSSFSFPAMETPPKLKERFERAQGILDRIMKVPGLRQLPYRLVLVEMEHPNAFAFPGGTVGVTPPLLEKVQSEEGLAMVIGHEFGHHQGRHPLKRLGRGLLVQSFFSLVLGTGVPPLVDKGFNLAELSYTRDQEIEADEYGMWLVFQLFGTTEGCLEFFEMLEREKLDNRARWEVMVTTHPYTLDRMTNLRAYAQKLLQEKPH